MANTSCGRRRLSSERHISSDFIIVFNFILSARIISAFWSNISDCDETYNYWEPAHFLLYGKGFQTWEYSPVYALRSYAYILMHIFPLWMIQPLLQPIYLFYSARIVLGIFCTYCEVYFYRGILIQLGQSVGHLSLAFMTLGVGMFISSTAFLPSSTSMYLCLLSYGAWFHGRNEVAIFATAVSTLFSWPFAGALGVPIAVDILFRQQRIRFFIEWCILSFLFIAFPQIVIDWVYYGKPVFAPLNIVLYNIFTSHGPDLYGTEPWYFYILNGFLNFNVVFLLSLFVVPIGLIAKLFSSSSLSQDIPFVTIYLGFYLWLGIFTLQPHKEERFLFPIYPLICLGGAHSIESLGKIYRAIVSKLLGAVTLIRLWKWIPIAFIAVFSILSCSRLMSLYVNYHAPTSLWIQLNNLPGKASQGVKVEKNVKYTVCVGKEWYRFPTSFFLPSTSWNIEFLKSDFKGQLPRHYEEDDTHATRRVYKEFNDQNKEEDTRYRVSALDCDFIVDQDTGSEESEREKNYIRHSKVWKEVFSYGMLSSVKSGSNRFLRAFYLPYLSSMKNEFNTYALLRNELRFNRYNAI
eukprot:TRINITY_DN6412_c0_g1_i1.p1 TRINITY_DN6412_c0_g1~~TRINITY_DN6412_c0_g1_i1.p1  ORF type:complete len:577 (-),score=53.78 TRINITY_DN6412_c0_g1_i1:48-1778(-)